MKKVCFMLIVLILLCGCDAYAFANTYPFDSGTAWYCEELDFLLDYQNSQTQKDIENGHTMVLNGEEITVEVLFHSNYFAIYQDGEKPVALEDKLIGGTWEYDDGKLVMHIDDDYASIISFSELVFIPQH